MNIMNIHIDETLDIQGIRKLKETLATLPHVINVELNTSLPHDLLVECEGHYNMPAIILDNLIQQGLHVDVQGC